MASAKPFFIYPGFAFVGYPNRDSTPFRERYNIPEAQTVIRGTLRYQGFPEMIKVLVDIGFLDDTPNSVFDKATSWKEATKQVLGASSSSEKDLHWAISSKTSFPNNEERDRLLSGLRWIGLFSDEQTIPRGNALDTLCATLEKKMQYGPDERDLVMLQHKFEIENKDGSKETRTSTLCEYGNPAGYSAMAKVCGPLLRDRHRNILTNCSWSVFLAVLLSSRFWTAPSTRLYVLPYLTSLKSVMLT
jgi:saccharopine dehydrogenase (NADP+, L-glutamate forming)